MNHVFFLILLAVSIYCLSSVVIVLVRLRSIGKSSLNEDPISIRRTVAALHNRSANVSHVIGATFYLFGVVFFLSLQAAPRALGHSRNPLEMEVLPTFVVLFAFAANVLLVILVLHLLSWFVRNRLNSNWSNSEVR
jgi:hypothetical protein